MARQRSRNNNNNNNNNSEQTFVLRQVWTKLILGAPRAPAHRTCAGACAGARCAQRGCQRCPLRLAASSAIYPALHVHCWGATRTTRAIREPAWGADVCGVTGTDSSLAGGLRQLARRLCRDGTERARENKLAPVIAHLPVAKSLIEQQAAGALGWYYMNPQTRNVNHSHCCCCCLKTNCECVARCFVGLAMVLGAPRQLV